ncbi:MAG: 2-(1,2-epoxy-1,2-dihydrophenyl)acetyl-CoA isomerase [Kordiimonadales bacterium]|nr:MAG: 2-(1,2-epoxy-1,2-dihydrophenyl)acetyl-CoA isomerase [Kordiimonadales bacterium]
MADYETLKLDISGGLATITLNRPDRLNALSAGLKAELLKAVRQIGKPASGVRGLLLTGEGRAFCSGADLAEGNVGGDADSGANLMDTYHPLILELAALEMPVVSAVNGVAAGAGMSLALAADIVVASKSAYFLQAFINIGLVPDAGSTYVLPRLVGNARARAMMMLGEKIPAETALDWGMIYKVTPDADLMETATALATKLANGPTKALSGIRKLIASSADNGFPAQLQAEALTQRMASQTSDCVEGVTAFIQKRATNFSGQ